MRHTLLALILLSSSGQVVLPACQLADQATATVLPGDARFCQGWPSCALQPALEPRVAAAAEQGKLPDSLDVLVGRFDITPSAGEFVRVFLEKDNVYRVEFSGADLDLRPRRSGQQPLLQLADDGTGASRTHVVKVVPREDGEYVFRGYGMSGVSLQLVIYRDVRESGRWARLSGTK